jgi:hypothetical protein
MAWGAMMRSLVSAETILSAEGVGMMKCLGGGGMIEWMAVRAMIILTAVPATMSVTAVLEVIGKVDARDGSVFRKPRVWEI